LKPSYIYIYAIKMPILTVKRASVDE
jgi:hypothetical protein